MAFDVFERKHHIVVAGGGLVGWATAVTAARAGRKVLLVSRRPNLGWEITAALDLWLGSSDAELAGLAREVLDRLVQQNAARDGVVTAPAVEMLLDAMAAEAGVEMLLYATPLSPVVFDGRARGLLVGSKSGQQTLRADLVVDATDNLLLAREAGLAATSARVAGRSALIMNGAAGPVEAQKLGDAAPAQNVTIRPTIWPGEAIVTFTLPSTSAVEAQLALPAVLRLVRDRSQALRGAVVTTTSVEPLPLESPVAAKADADGEVMPGLVAAGPASRCTRKALSSADRIAMGEAAGSRAAGLWHTTDNVDLAEAGSLLPAPPHRQCDVLVLGGGTAGAFAAIAAARQGARTTVIEPLPYLGGIGTGGGIHSYYHGVTGGVQDEIDARVAELQPLFLGDQQVAGFHPDAKKVALLEAARRDGVEVVFNATATGVTTEPVASTDTAPARRGSAAPATVRVRTVVTAGPDGAQVYEARAFVDSTGDGDIAAMAGASFVFGREKDGLLHAFSQSAGRLNPVVGDKGADWAMDVLAKGPAPATEKIKMAIVNFDAGFLDPDDITDLTRGRRLGLNHLRIAQWLPQERWTYIAPHLGLRQGRQIIGDYQLTMGDEIAGATFPDVIAYAVSHYDNHAHDYEGESDAGAVWVWLAGQWQTRFGCEIPYRCLLPRGIEGLLVACRALSLTQDAHYQLRMERDMQRLGEAAGIAAALAAKAGTTPRALGAEPVQAVLRDLGALRESDRPKPALPERTTDEVIADLGTPAGQLAVWRMASESDAGAVATLRQELKSSDPARRFWSAAALAVARDKSAVPELTAAVKERRADAAEGRKTVPSWIPSIVLLGRVGDRSSLPVLKDVLADRESPLSAVVAAVRAIGRIGDPSAADALHQLVARDDLPAERVLQVSMGAKMRVVENARWQVDLAVTEALARIGKPDPVIAQPYLRDDRAYVRRYARRVLEAAAGGGDQSA